MPIVGSGQRNVCYNDPVIPGDSGISGSGIPEQEPPNYNWEHAMICAVVRYTLPPSIDRAACRDHHHKIAPGFRDVPGLVSKHFICAENGTRRRRLPVGDAAKPPRPSIPGRGGTASSSATESSPRSSSSPSSASPTTRPARFGSWSRPQRSRRNSRPSTGSGRALRATPSAPLLFSTRRTGRRRWNGAGSAAVATARRRW